MHVINEDWWSMTQNIDLSEKVPTVNLLTDKFGKSGGSYTNLDGDKNSNIIHYFILGSLKCVRKVKSR